MNFSALRQLKLSRRRDGFTAIELLVTIGIIVLLAGLLLPMIVKAVRSGSRARTSADLSAIDIGLDAYKGDFGTYPTVDTAGTGFAVLGKTMIGPFGDGRAGAAMDDQDPPRYDAGKTYKPGDCVFMNANDGTDSYVALVENIGQTPPNPQYWAQLNVHDFQDGPGFKARAGGKVYGPYLAPGKFKTRGLAILDTFGNPIMYFPASPVKINLAIPNTLYVSSADTGTPGGNALVAGGGTCMYKFDDNGRTAISLTTEQDQQNPYRGLARMQAMMGAARNIAQSGAAKGNLSSTDGETAITTAPYVLWSCGPDGRFGAFNDITTLTDLKDRRDACRKCDDVTSFNGK
jgi:prepilin-type N-terminal cleavage/methylation domain-containing protein